jgi:hypothetical protein
MASKIKVSTGTLHWEGDKIEVKGAKNPALDALAPKIATAEEKLFAKLHAVKFKKPDGDEATIVRRFLEDHKPGGERVAEKTKKLLSIGRKHARKEAEGLEALLADKFDKEVAILEAQGKLVYKAIDDHSLVKGAPKKAGDAFRTALDTKHEEFLHEARDLRRTRGRTLLNHVPETSAPGKAVEKTKEGKEKTPEAKNTAKKDAEETIEKKEGFWAGLVSKAKKNLGSEAWEESKMKAGFRSLGVVVGLGAIIDSVSRRRAKDDMGNEIDRSASSRVTEGVVGAALAGGSAFIGGGRVK